MTVLTVVLAIIIGCLILVAQIEERVVAGKALDRSAVVALDRFLRETRLSDSIDTDNSIFNDPESVLVLSSAVAGGTVRFYVSEENSLYIEKGGENHRLTHKNTEVQLFRINKIDSGENDAVKVELILSHPYSDGSIVQNFYTTAILRGSYGQQ